MEPIFQQEMLTGNLMIMYIGFVLFMYVCVRMYIAHKQVQLDIFTQICVTIF